MVNKPYVEKIMSDSCFTLKLSMWANFRENLIGSHKTKNHPKIYTKCVLQYPACYNFIENNTGQSSKPVLVKTVRHREDIGP